MATDDTRTRILHAAGTAFGERGYEKATIREIASLAEVNLASVNYHFGDKEQLYLEVIRLMHRARVEEAPFPDWPPETPPDMKLRDFVGTILTRLLSTDELSWQARVITREMLQPSGVGRKLIESLVRPQHELLLGIINELVPASTPEHRRELLALSVFGQCVFYRSHREIIRMLLPMHIQQNHLTIEDLTDHITGVMLSALGRSGWAPDDGSTEESSLPNPLALER